MGKDIFLKNGRFGPYLQFEIEAEEINEKKTKRSKKKKGNENLKNVSIPKGLSIENVDIDKAKILMFIAKKYW